MKAKLMLALSAIVLAFAVTSCDTTTGNRGPIIPVGLVGYYTVGEDTVRILGNGRGSVSGTEAIFSVTDNTLTVTMGNQTITVDFQIAANGDVTFSNIQGDTGSLRTVFQALVTASPIRPSPTPPAAAVIPPELVGTWVLVNAVTDLGGPALGIPAYTLPAGSTIFEINADGTGKARNEAVAYPAHFFNDASWAATPTTITLTIDMEAAGLGILATTFNWSIASGTGHLTLSGGVAANANLMSAGLIPFQDYSPFVRVIVEGPSPSEIINAVAWAETIREEFTGTWTTAVEAFAGRRVFAIRANGTGYVYRSTVPGFYEATYRLSQDATATSGRLLLTIANFGRVMYTVTIAENQLTLSEPVIDGPSALGTYGDFFNPFTRTEGVELPFNYSEFTWQSTIPATHTGTWSFTVLDIFTIASDGTGTVAVGQDHVPALFALCEDADYLLVTIPGLGRTLFEIEIDGEGQLILKSGNPDAGGEFLAGLAIFFSTLTRN